MQKEILLEQVNLKFHPMYRELNSLKNLRIFMQYHVFAVWDFMSLLKSLQKELTSVKVPWSQSSYNAEMVRLINEIVLGEESDVDQNGVASSHFELYLKAMNEIGADTSLIHHFLQDFNFNQLPSELNKIVSYHLDIALNQPVHCVAASFFYGREKLIPEMFESIVEILETEKLDCPTLIYYLKRHIEVDGEEHGPKALQFLNHLIQDPQKKKEAEQTANQSLKMRQRLWNFILSQMQAAN